MNSSPLISRRFHVPLIVGLLALGGAIAYVKSMLRHTAGVPSPPLDDTYIYLQYARRWAGGHFLSYCDGAPASTGASSYLQMALMLPGWLAGLRDSSFVWWAVGSGALCLAVCLGAGARLAAAWAAAPGEGRRPAWPPTGIDAWWAPAAFLAIAVLNGHLLWAAFTGMDTVLYAAGLVLVLAGLAARGPAPGWPWLLAGGLSLFRPEGIPLGLLALAVMYGAALREKASVPADGAAAETMAPGGAASTPAGAARGRTAPAGAVAARAAARRLRYAAGAALLVFAPALINLTMTGSAVWDSVRVKSGFAEMRPDYLHEMLRRLPEVWRDIAFLHVNDFRSGSWSVPAGWALEILLAAGLISGAFIAISGRRGAAGRLAVLWLAAGIVLGGLSPVWQSHYYRYQIPYAPIAAALTVAGWAALTRRLPGPARVASRAVIAALAAFLLWPGAVMMRDLYGRNCSNILDQQTKVGRWIAANTPPGTRVALNDAGAIAYYGNRPVIDLVGLVTHGFAAPYHQGIGAVFEKLEKLPVKERPALMAIYPAWFPYLVRTGFTGPVLFSADLRDNTICGDRLKQVYRIDWSVAGGGDRPVGRETLIRDFGMKLVDEVDVEDLDSEAAHAYAWRRTWRDRLREFPTAAEPEVGATTAAADSAGGAAPPGRVVEDGGRWISEAERMTVRTRPGQWLVMIMRTETELPFQLDVSVNGRPAGQLAARGLPLMWTEPLVQIPDSLVTDSLVTVDVKWVRNVRADGYNSYHYWFLQP